MAAGSWTLNGNFALVSLLIYAQQILKLKGTPVDILAAPGAGKAIIPVSVAVSLQFKTTPFQNAGLGTDLPLDPQAALCYFGPSLYPAFSLGNSFYDLLLSTQDSVQVLTSAAQAVLPRGEIENRPLVLCNTDAHAADFLNGDSNLLLSLLYATVNL